MTLPTPPIPTEFPLDWRSSTPAKPLPKPAAADPATSVPMRLPLITLPVVPGSNTPTPEYVGPVWPFAEMTLASVPAPPITLFAEPLRVSTPYAPFPAAPPPRATPIQLPATRFPPPVSSRMPSKLKPVIDRPRTVLLPATMWRPLAPAPADEPSSRTSGTPA